MSDCIQVRCDDCDQKTNTDDGYIMCPQCTAKVDAMQADRDELRRVLQSIVDRQGVTDADLIEARRLLKRGAS